MPLFYDPDAGFIVRIDFVNKLPICYDYVKVSYGIFIKKYIFIFYIKHWWTQNDCYNKLAWMQLRKCVCEKVYYLRKICWKESWSV